MTTTALDTPCREYRGQRTAKGYGRKQIDGATVMLHRWIVELVEGRKLEPGEVVMHRCDNPPCFRYDHLRRATQRENILDAVAKGRHRHGRTQYRLTEEDAATIRQRIALGHRQIDIAHDYGVAPCHVANIKAGRKWPSN